MVKEGVKRLKYSFYKRLKFKAAQKLSPKFWSNIYGDDLIDCTILAGNWTVHLYCLDEHETLIAKYLQK